MFGGLVYADCSLDGFIDCHKKPPFIVFRKHETPAVIGRCLALSTMVMTDFSKIRLIAGQFHFKKQDSFSGDVDFFTFACYNYKNKKTGQEGKHESRTDDIGLLAGYGHI